MSYRSVRDYEIVQRTRKKRKVTETVLVMPPPNRHAYPSWQRAKTSRQQDSSSKQTRSSASADWPQDAMNTMETSEDEPTASRQTKVIAQSSHYKRYLTLDAE